MTLDAASEDEGVPDAALALWNPIIGVPMALALGIGQLTVELLHHAANLPRTTHAKMRLSPDKIAMFAHGSGFTV